MLAPLLTTGLILPPPMSELRPPNKDEEEVAEDDRLVVEVDTHNLMQMKDIRFLHFTYLLNNYYLR